MRKWFNHIKKQEHLREKFNLLGKFLLSRNFIFSALAISILIVFNNPIEEIVSISIVTPLLSKVQSILYNDLIFTAVSVYIIGVTVYLVKQHYTPSNKLTTLLIIATIFYLWYRVQSDIWVFVPFKTIEFFKYLDIIIMIAVCQVVLLLFKSKKVPKPNTGFILETPLGESDIDKLGYATYASDIVDRILKTFSKKSFAIGINGIWGIGKTSFIDLVKRKLKGNNIIEVDFKPWNSHGSDAIIKDFFDTIQNKLSPYHSSLAKQLMQYSEKLVYVENSLFTRILKSIFSSNSTLKDLKESIQESLIKIDKKIIIYIDDLDRLDKHEVVEVLRLIRNTASFYNTFFMVAYDRNYVISAIDDFNSYNKEAFLEKIFQLEISLPHFKHKKILDALNSQLKENLADSLEKDIHNEIMIYGLLTPKYLEDWIVTMRDVIRFTNQFVISIKNLEQDVVFSEFFKLELVRFKFPAVYELMHRKTTYFFETDGILVDPKRVYRLKKGEQTETNGDYIVLQKHLKSEYQYYSIPLKSVEFVVSLIDSIFSPEGVLAINEPKEPLSISYPSKFSRYFSLTLDDAELSEIDFNKARALSQQEFNQKVSNWVEDDLELEVKSKFEDIKEYDDKEDFEKVITSIFFFASLPTVQGSKSRHTNIGFDYELLYNKLNEDIIAKNYYYNDKQEYKKFLLGIFSNAKTPYFFEALFIYNAKRNHLSFPLTQKELEEISENYLEQYCNEVDRLDSNIWTLYKFTKEREHPVDKDNPTKLETNSTRVKGIMNSFIIEKDLDGFIEGLFDFSVFKENHRHYKICDTAIIEIFGSVGGFDKLLTSNIKNSKYLVEFRAFLKELNVKGYNHFIPYDFKEIPIEAFIKKRNVEIGM